MWFQKAVATVGGDVWRSWHMLALWPWPAVVWGKPESKLDPDDYRCFTRYMKPGDMLLATQDPFLLSNAAISGTIQAPKSLGVGYMHSVASHDDDRVFTKTITHAVSEGVICQDILSMMIHEDYVIAVRPWRTTSQQAEVVNRALELVGLGYNFDFSPAGPRELYCTELGSECLSAAKLPVPQPAIKKISFLGKKGPVFLADSFLAAFPSVCCSASCREPKFYRGSRYGDVIRQRILAAQSPA
jgi:hypothetical protein